MPTSRFGNKGEPGSVFPERRVSVSGLRGSWSGENRTTVASSDPWGGRMRLTRIVYWGSTGLSALLFAAPGFALVSRNAQFAADMARMGYPSYFLPFLGVWKILGAIVILAPGVPRLKEWAYAGMIFDVSGAVVSRAAAGDRGPELFLPFLIAGLVILSWALRPSGRHLAAPDGSGLLVLRPRR